MLFAVRMDVSPPHDFPPEVRAELGAREKAYSRELQAAGTWKHIWRVTGSWANISIFDVSSHEELHDILWNLPLYKYMKVSVTPLSTHPSTID